MTAYIKIERLLPAQVSSTYRLNITKREMELILQGYPPWYQNPLSLPGGRHVPHPIVEESDLSRGGWVVAVGLSPTRPIATDFMERKDGSVVILDRALGRVAQCLGNIQRAFPEEGRVSTARSLVEDVISMIGSFGYSGSHLHFLYERANFKDCIADPARPRGRRNLPIFTEGLTDRQIMRTLKVLNYDEQLTDDEASELRPVLQTVLQASMCGVFKVVIHLYVVGARRSRPCVLPPELETDGLIYVRERWESLED
jgi:hypothetical protein